MKHCSFFKLAAATAFFVQCWSAQAEVAYTIIDLGVIGPVQTDSASIARAINSSGEVTGNSTSSNAGGDQRAFLYSGGVMHDLGTDSSGDLSYGYGINDAGVVVGTVEQSQAFYFSNNKLTGIGTLPGGVDGSAASGINASGTIVGSSSVSGGNSVAFVYSGGHMTDLKDLQGDDTSSYSAAFAINNSGVIVGMCQILVYDNQTGENNPVTKAMIYTGGQMTELPPLDQTTVATAYGINSGGEIVGVSGGNAASWTGGSLQAVPMVAGAQGSVAYGINDAAQIVGSYATKTFGLSHAFVCTGGVCHDLNDLATGGNLGGFEYLEIAYAINNSGTIVGEAFKSGPNGGVRGPFAFMAKPSAPTVVPPPAGVGMLTAAQNDPAPGFGSTTVPGVPVFSVAGPPAIDKSGDVAFHAVIKETSKTDPVTAANNSGIWLYVGTVGSLIARTGDPSNPAPVTGNPLFTKLSDPVLSSEGDLAFIGTYAGGTPKLPSTSGIFVRKSAGTLALAWAVGDAAPVTGESGLSDVVFTSFEELAVENGGGVAFLATVKGHGITAANNSGLWSTDSKGDLQLLALKGAPLPGITPSTKAAGLTAFKPLAPVDGQSRSIDTVNGYGALLVSAKSPSTLFFETTRATAGGYTYADPVTAGSTFAGLTLKSLEEPIVNEAGALAFLATVSGTGITAADDLVLATMTPSASSIIARTHDASLPAPDETGALTAGDLFSGLENPVLNNGGSYAFIASLASGVGDTEKSGANGSGVWTNFGGAYERLVRKGDAAPGTIGRYLAFEQLVLPDVGGPIFTASLSGVPASQAKGLWAASKGVPSLILETGASLQVHTVTKTVRSFNIFQIPPLVMGQSRSFEATKGNLVYIATFTDGTWGIFSVAGS